MFVDIDLHDLHEECLQCSYARYIMKTSRSGQRAYNEKEEGKTAATLNSKKMEVASDERKSLHHVGCR